MTQENSDTLEPSAIVHVPAENGAGSSKPRPNLLERLGYNARHAIPDALEALPVVGPALQHGRNQEGRDNLYAGIGQGFGRLGRKSANIVQDSAEVVLRGVGATDSASYLRQQRLDSADTRKTENRIQDGVDATAHFGATALRSAGRILTGVVIGSLALASKLGTLAFTTLKNGAMALATGATELYKNTQEKWQDDQRARALDARKKQLENDRNTINVANERIKKTQQAIVDISLRDIAASFEKMLKSSPKEQDEIWLKMSSRIDTPEEMRSLLYVIDENPKYEALYDELYKRNPLRLLNPSAEAAPEKENISFDHLPEDLISSKNPALGQQGSGTPRTIQVTGLGSADLTASSQNQALGQQGSGTLKTSSATNLEDFRALLKLHLIQQSSRDAGA